MSPVARAATEVTSPVGCPAEEAGMSESIVVGTDGSASHNARCDVLIVKQ